MPRFLRAAVAAGVAAVAAGAVLAGASAPASAGPGGPEAPAPPGVTTVGTGSVSAPPDVMRASLALTHTAADVSTAMRRANEAVGQVRAALRAHGVADRDVRTTGLDVYRHGPGARRFHASQSMTVVLRDLERAGRTTAAAVEAGGDAVRVDGLEFSLSDRTALIRRARDEAFAEAKAKAQRYAAMTGRTLGPVRSVSEGVSYATVAQSPAGAAAAAPASKSSAAARDVGDVPFSAGRERTSVHTTVVWTLR